VCHQLRQVLEEKQERRGKAKRTMRIEGISSQTAGAATSNATTTSIAEEAGNAISVDDNRICSDEGSRKDKHSSSEKSGTRDRIAKKGPLCYGYR